MRAPRGFDFELDLLVRNARGRRSEQGAGVSCVGAARTHTTRILTLCFFPIRLRGLSTTFLKRAQVGRICSLSFGLRKRWGVRVYVGGGLQCDTTCLGVSYLHGRRSTYLPGTRSAYALYVR